VKLFESRREFLIGARSRWKQRAPTQLREKRGTSQDYLTANVYAISSDGKLAGAQLSRTVKTGSSFAITLYCVSSSKSSPPSAFFFDRQH
jgi:hypothetical protein